MITIAIIAFIGLSQSVFDIILLSFKNDKTVSDKILIFWFTIICLLFLIIINNHTDIINLPIGRQYIVIPTQLIYGPFLFVYINSIINEQFKLKKFILYHFMPLILLSVILIIFAEFAEISEGLTGEITLHQIIIISLISLISTFYSFWALYVLFQHRKTLKENYSCLSSQVTLKWITFVTVIMIAGFFSLLVIGSIERFVWGIKPQLVAYPNLIGFTIFAYAVSYYGVRQSSLIHHVSNVIPKLSEKVSPDEQTELIEKINNYMDSEKPYLKPDLTIQELADYLFIDRLVLSELINTQFKKNFFAFINEYRVQEVTNRLQNPEYQHLTLLSIGYDSGFNSKTSFNTIFKQYTGKTPSEYRKQL